MVREVVVIAGANGAGKTTFARWYLPVRCPEAEFLNAEEIQREADPPMHRVGAGRVFLRRLSALEESRLSFAIEVTLSSRRYAKNFSRWSSLGYRVVLHFIELPSADLAVRRVGERFASGGHLVPEIDVRRRFERGRRLFRKVYKEISDEWYHWLSDDGGIRLVDDWERT
jgi:predicted ABC-type ATPase